MIDATPKPLPQNRLGQLIRGLQERFTGSLQQTASEIENLNSAIREQQQRFSAEISQYQQEAATWKAQSTTEWDEEIHGVWDHAELQTYRAIYETIDREKQQRRAAKAKIGEVVNEAQNRIQEIERRFLQAKEVPLKRLQNFRAANQGLHEKLTEVEESTQASLAQRSLAIPSEAADAEHWIEPSHSQEAFGQLKDILQKAQLQSEKIANNGLVRFVDSIAFWAFCGVVFVATLGLLQALGLLPILPSILVAAGVTVVFLLVGFLGLRPWLKRAAAAEYPKLKGLIELGNRVFILGDRLAVAENESELSVLAQKRDTGYQEAKQWKDAQVAGIKQNLEQSVVELKRRAQESKQTAREFLSSSLAETKQRYKARFSARDVETAAFKDSRQSALDTQCGALRRQIAELDRGAAQRIELATQKALRYMSRSETWCESHFPRWEHFQSEHFDWPKTLEEPALPLGALALGEVLPEAVQRVVDTSLVHSPILFTPLQDAFLVVHGDPACKPVRELVRNLIVRSLTVLPPGKTQLCVIDPPGLGRDFGWLMHLGDFDPQLVSHRVWTQANHIAKQVNALAMAAEDFIQQSLRNQYANIVDYNRDAGALAEPFRILVWSSLPEGMDDPCWKDLQRLLDTGARCGIVPILIVDPEASWSLPEQRAFLENRGCHIRLDLNSQRFCIDMGASEPVRIDSHEAPSDALAQQIVQEVGRRSLLASRVEVPLESMLPAGEQRWQGDSTHSLEIPIGQSGVGRTHCLKLGIGTAQHAIIAGKTGSGKSSLLHALITSAILKYSPEHLRLVLLDFKKGVEFQVYSDAGVPHADIIGIESHREFGLSALEYMDACLQRRGEAFREAGVQDIAGWNALHPERPMPRVLVVVDEFQELFVEDDKLSGQASLILDRIVRQGRSFGVHSVLSSQTLAGSYSLPRTTLGQMAVRIALQCDAADAQIIFDNDNPAALRLKRPGQAVYNDAGGRIEGNQPMQIGWLPKQKQMQWFAEIPGGYRNGDSTTNRLGRTVVYDGNRAATWSDQNADLALRRASEETNPDAIWCVAGESVAIHPAVVFPLTRQSGRNVLIVGADDAQAAAVMDVVASSFFRSGQSGEEPCLFVVQGAKPTDAKSLGLSKRWSQFMGEKKIADARAAEEVVGQVYELLQARVEREQEEPEARSVLLALIQIGRMRSLKRADDFAGFGESEMTADKKLEEILRDGPSHGIHTLIWAENYSTVSRWLSRSSLREIEIRMLMQMSGSDSTNLIDSIAASRLGEHVMLLFDEATGQEQRFRPFAIETLGRLANWAGNS